MKNVKILCDTSADLNLEQDVTLYDKYNISTFPMQIIFDEKAYKELEELTPSKFYKLLESGELGRPRTSQPAQYDILTKFEKYGQEYDDILSIHISSELSGSYSNGKMAKKLYQRKTDPSSNIVVYDSKLASSAMGLLVIKAAKLAEAGWAIDDIVKELDRWKNEDFHVVFTVSNLQWLFEGGRLSKAKYYIANLLNKKPILGFDEGNLSVFKSVTSIEKTISTMKKMLLEYFGNSKQDLMCHIVHADYKDQAEKVMTDILKEHDNIKEGKIFVLGGTIGSHTGPETLGILMTRNFEY